MQEQAPPLPLRLPLIVGAENRDATTDRDSKLINGYVEIDGQKNLHIYKRPGLSVHTTVAAAAAGGCFNWLDNIYAIFGSVLYKNGVSAGTGLNTAGGVYTFSVTLGTVPKLFLQNGVAAYTFDGTTLATIPASTTLTPTGTLTGGSAAITSMSSTTGILVGASVSGTNVPSGATVLSVDSSTQITLSAAVVMTKTPLEFSATSSAFGAGSELPKTYEWTVSTDPTSTVQVGDFITIRGFADCVTTTVVSTTATKIIANQASWLFTGSTSWVSAPATLVISNSATATQAGTALTIINPGTQTGFLKGQAYLDAVTYMLTSKAYVNGSARNDVSTWPADNSIAAMIEPDLGVTMNKQLTYVLAFKRYSVEVFYDAANAEGSPLKSVPGMKLNVGCKSADSVQSAEGSLFWLAQTKDGSIQVVMLDGMKLAIVSSPSIEKLLQQADYTYVQSWVARINGHRFYGITLKASNLTLVYDAITQLWAQWTDSAGNYFPFVASVVISDQHTLLQHETDGKLYKLDVSVFADNGTVFPVDIFTPNWDGGTRKKKYLKLIDFIGDQTDGSLLYVQSSDDDYQNWTEFRRVDMSKTRPFLANCGTFRRRAYHIKHLANTPMRLQAMELQTELGSM